LFLIGIAIALYRLLPVRDAACRARRKSFGHPLRQGDIFKLFMIAYLGLRVVLDFWKPSDPAIFLGMGSLQVASLIAAVVAAWQMWARPGAAVQREQVKEFRWTG
jgi:prolipoprotein diacylglyceryltransferase